VATPPTIKIKGVFIMKGKFIGTVLATDGLTDLQVWEVNGIKVYFQDVQTELTIEDEDWE
jgi:hypothetical protein